jgi:hypothetical protein
MFKYVKFSIPLTTHKTFFVSKIIYICLGLNLERKVSGHGENLPPFCNEKNKKQKNSRDFFPKTL